MSCNKIPSRIMQADYAGDYSVYQNAVYQLYLKTFSEKQFYLRQAHPRKAATEGFWYVLHILAHRI